MRPAYVYRCYDAADQLLYIGSTVNVRARMRAHRYHKPELRSRLHRVETERYSSIAIAREAERRAIFNESPLLNKQNNHRESAGAPIGPDGWVRHP